MSDNQTQNATTTLSAYAQATSRIQGRSLCFSVSAPESEPVPGRAT